MIRCRKQYYQMQEDQTARILNTRFLPRNSRIAKRGFLIGFRKSLPRLPDPGPDGVGVTAQLLGDVSGGEVVLHALVDDLVLLLLGQVLSVLGLVLTCRGPEAQKHDINEGFEVLYNFTCEKIIERIILKIFLLQPFQPIS